MHLLNPHPPYLRAADCTIRDVDAYAWELDDWGDGSEFGDASACLHQQLIDAVELILDEDDDPVIIIQGDHGPRLGVEPAEDGSFLYEDDPYFSIFSAIRLPSGCDVEVPSDLTSVNTFRLVHACLRGEEPDLLPNRRYPILRPRG